MDDVCCPRIEKHSSQIKMIKQKNSFGKADKFAAFFDRLLSIGSPAAETAIMSNNGEGSSFLSVPIKRNVLPRSESSVPDSHLDFQSYLESFMIQSQGVDVSPLLPEQSQWQELNQLRIHAGAPERTEKGVERLMNYYAQLCWLEERFPFETNKLVIPFSWYEAFYSKKPVVAKCLQYEKAAVMWNIGSVYSQLGVIQSLWTEDGLKSAAQYFQRAAGAFIHVRDVLVPRISLKLDGSTDLSDGTLSAVVSLLLAQAVECFYIKAEFDNTSSPVTSQIAAQTSDYYEMSHKAAKSNNSIQRMRLPEAWSKQCKVKFLLYSAYAHYHCPNFKSPEAVVGERMARLQLAFEIINQANEKCATNDTACSAELRAVVRAAFGKIKHALDEVDEANFEKFHQSVPETSSLRPLRRPPHALVAGVNIVDELGTGSIADAICNRNVVDIFENVVSMMKAPRKSSFVNHSHSFVGNRRISRGKDSQKNSMQALSAYMSTPSPNEKDDRRLSESLLRTTASLEKETIDSIKHFLRDVKALYDFWNPQIDASQKACVKYIETLLGCIDLAHSVPRESVIIPRSDSLLERYSKCEQISNICSSKQLCKNLSLLKSQIEQSLVSSDNEVVIRLAHAWHSQSPVSLDDYSLPSFLNDFHSHPAVIADFLRMAEKECFMELFDDASESESQWNMNKIRTVVPCLEVNWRAQYDNYQSNLLDVAKQLGLKPLPGSPTEELFHFVAESLGNVEAKVIEHSQKLDEVQDALSSLLMEWYGDGEVRKTANVLERLMDIAQNRKSQDFDQVSDRAVSYGLKVARNELEQISERIRTLFGTIQMGEMSLKNVESLCSRLRKSCDFMMSFESIEQESEKIVMVFEEQLRKWQDWHQSASDEITLLKKIDEWLLPNLRRKPSTVGASQEIDYDETLVSKLAQCSFNMANTTINHAVSSSQTSKDSMNVHSPEVQRRNLMRKLSHTATMIDKVSRKIECDRESNLKSSNDADKNDEALKRYLRILSQQQQEFYNLHKTHLDNLMTQQQQMMQGFSTQNKRVSLFDVAKDKISSIVGSNGLRQKLSPTSKKAFKTERKSCEIMETPHDIFSQNSIMPSAPDFDHLIKTPKVDRTDDILRRKSTSRKPVERKRSTSVGLVRSHHDDRNCHKWTGHHDSDERTPRRHSIRVMEQKRPHTAFRDDFEVPKVKYHPAMNLKSNTQEQSSEQFDRSAATPSPVKILNSLDRRPNTVISHYIESPVIPMRPSDDDGSVLRNGMESVTRYFAWNREALMSSRQSGRY